MARILIEAIQNGKEHLAMEIIMKCASSGGIDSQTSRREGTALFFCCSRGYLQLANLLLEKGASVTSTDKNLATPLHAAVDNGHIDVVRLLISYGANVNAQNYRGDTPLHLAAYRGFADITHCLVEAGANFLLVNSNFFTAENEAVGRGHVDLCNYLRLVQSVQLHLPRSTPTSFDSMIQLDPPTVTSATSTQMTSATSAQMTSATSAQVTSATGTQMTSAAGYRLQLKQQLEHEVTGGQHVDMNRASDLAAKWRESEGDRFKHLSVIGLEPPPDVDPQKVTSYRHRPAPMNLLPSTHVTAQPPHSPSGWVVTWSHEGTLPSVTLASPGQAYHMASRCSRLPPSTSQLGSYNMDACRRLSSGSVSSYFSDLCPGSGSDAGSLPSCGSDAGSLPNCGSDAGSLPNCGSDAGSLPSCGSDRSGLFGDSRRDDLDPQDNRLSNTCPLNTDDNDLALRSFGVKNPPSQKHKRQLSTTSESTDCPDFSDIYDSTLFSLKSMTSGSRSASGSGPSSSSMDFTISRAEKNGPKLNRMDTCDHRPKIHRAISVTPCPHLTLKARPGYNKSVSAEYGSRFHSHLDRPSSDVPSPYMTSNDLSSSCSLLDKSSCSMTCVNIPLN